MKKLLTAVVVAAAAFGLFATNPDKDDFQTYIRKRVERRMANDAGDSRLGRLLTGMGASVAGSVAANVSERSNYYLMSVYTVDVGADGASDEQWKFVGVAGRFIEIESPGHGQ